MSGVAELSTADLADLAVSLAALRPAVDDADRIERIRQIEILKSTLAAAQALETAAFAASQRAEQAVAGVPTSRQGRGVAAQLGLARRISPWQAQRYLGWAAVLTRELPETFASLQAGRISEWRAMLVARETIWLSREHRAQVDAELAPKLAGWGDRQVEAEAKKAGYRLDQHGFLGRVRGAEKDRRVTVRPAPDVMARLTALLPVAQGVAAFAALSKAADLSTAGGDERGRGQIMADTLVERVTGQVTADAVPVEIELIMTDTTLLYPTCTAPQSGDEEQPDGLADTDDDTDAETDIDSDADEPAVIVGYGPIPAGLARELALGITTDNPNSTDTDGSSDTDETPRWLRRLFRHPTTGQLAAMESTRRLFTANQRRFVRLRDQHCRTPWCNAPIRHTDHVVPHGAGGPTHTGNAQGSCVACNHATQAPGWSATVDTDGGITTQTPTGHRYRSGLPDPPGVPPVVQPSVDERLRRLTAGSRLAA